jgi:hypothetical protein
VECTSRCTSALPRARRVVAAREDRRESAAFEIAAVGGAGLKRVRAFRWSDELAFGRRPRDGLRALERARGRRFTRDQRRACVGRWSRIERACGARGEKNECAFHTHTSSRRSGSCVIFQHA